MEWAKYNDDKTDAQFYFIPSNGTRDVVFTLHAFYCYKQFIKKRGNIVRLSISKKAFYSVDRRNLWLKLSIEN